MRRDSAVWLIAVAVLGMVLFAGCGKSKKSEEPQAQMPGAYSQQQMQPAAAQPAEPEEVELSGAPYRERYKQGQLTAKELQQEHALQQVERELGYPVGPQ